MADEVLLSAPSVELYVPSLPGNIFYRAAQNTGTAAGRPRLEITSPSGDLILHGRSGTTYTLEVTPTLGAGAQWLPVLTIPMTNAIQTVPGLMHTNATGFYRVREN